MRSMTGFGTASTPLPSGGAVVVEVRTVNHRYLEVMVRTSRDLSDIAGALEHRIRARKGRGRYDVALRLEGRSEETVTLDVERARSAWTALSKLRDELAPNETVPLSVLSIVPDLFRSKSSAPQLLAASTEALDAALVALDTSREREGVCLQRDLTAHARALMMLCDTAETLAKNAARASWERLVDRAGRLSAELGAVRPEGTRMESELVLLLERGDIAEELSRLRIHGNELMRLLTEVREPTGKHIDFLLQELLREANTVASKALSAELSQTAVAMKLEIERIREQVQNVE